MKRKESKKNRGFGQIYLATFLIIAVAVLGLTIGNKLMKNFSSAETSRNNTVAENSQNNESIIKISKPNGGGLISNTFTDKNNPFILLTNTSVSFYATFDKSQVTSTYSSKTRPIAYSYNNNIKSLDNSAYCGHNYENDGKDLEAYCTFSNEGLYVISLYSSEEGKEIEEIYVRVLSPNKMYVKNSAFSSEIIQNVSSVGFGTGDEAELIAILTDVKNMDGDVPSEAIGSGNGFFSWDSSVTIKNEWEKLYGNNWILRMKVKSTKNTAYSILLCKDGTLGVDSMYLMFAGNRITVDTVKIGSREYHNVNKNVATRMFLGMSETVNTDYDRYTVYVGETLNLTANVEGMDYEGLHFDLDDSNIVTKLSVTENDNVLKASYKGAKVGKGEVYLKDANDDIIETFFIDVHYPINVNTNVGEFNKNGVHEFLGISFNGLFKGNPRMFVTDPSGNPIYIKNGTDTYYSYYLGKGDTVVLTTYTSKNDTTKFKTSDGLEIVPLTGYNYADGTTDYVVTEELTGNMAGYQKLTAEFKVTATSGQVSASFGTESFDIYVTSENSVSDHFDVEIADKGTYTIIENITYADGTVDIISTEYYATLADVYGSKIYDKDDKLLIELTPKDYWHRNKPRDTQYEVTSAYLTNDDGKLVDKNGAVIEDNVKIGYTIPVLATRNVPLSSISKAVFTVKLSLVPIQKTTVTIFVDKDGKEVESAPVVEKVSNPLTSVDKLEIETGYRDLIDAYNKCPTHGGLDYTIFHIEEVHYKVPYNKNPNTSAIISITVLGIGALALGLMFGVSKFRKNKYN